MTTRSITVRLPAELVARIDQHADGRTTRTDLITDALQERYGDDAEPAPAPLEAPEGWVDSEFAGTGRLPPREDPVPTSAAALLPPRCSHPKSARKVLACGVQCGECGELVR